MSKKAADGFESYFTEKIWEMIPAIYRHEDGLAENPGVLRALVELVAGHAAILRRSHDRLWEDQFIELCSDWVVPYIADLFGTRLVSAKNLRGRRVDVAKTIYYRRRKGTPRVLEELISDIADWEGKLVENFLSLARTRHGLDPHPAPLAGTFSGTMPGGWADLRKQRGSELAGGPFCEFYHTPDMRRHNGVDGRYAIPKLALFLYRLKSFEVRDAVPFPRTAGGFTIDPSGRSVPLFMKRNRPADWEEWYSAHEWELPAPMPCRMLDYALNNNINLIPGSVSVKEDGVNVLKEDITAANLDNWDVSAVSKQLAIHPEQGRLMFTGTSPGEVKVTYHYGFSAEIGAGTYNRPDVEANTPDINVSGGGDELTAPKENIKNDKVTQINDSVTYSPISGKTGIINLTLQAANRERPYLRLKGNWILNTDSKTNSQLTLDGLWIGSDGDYKIILRGNYEKVLIRHCTIDPGEKYGTDVNGDSIYAVPLVINGFVEQLEIEASIIGPIQVGNDCLMEKLVICDSILQSAGTTPAVNLFPIPGLSKFVFKLTETSFANLRSAKVPVKTLKKLVIIKNRVFTTKDKFLESVKRAIKKEVPALHLKKILKYAVLACKPTDAELNRVTVFGAMKVHRLWASDTLVTGEVQVTDTQNGCFRFSAAPQGSRLPKPYESYTIDDSHHYFTSLSFGQSGYAQLSETAPLEIQQGAENGSEMGAFNMLLNPIKMDSLQAKVDEYMPFGRIPIYIKET